LVGGIGVDRGVDRFQIPGDLFALTPGDVLQRVADQMHDAGLHRGLGKDRLDCLGKPFEAVHAADQDV
jgi:hypothetical protein